ncbi:hypothetical protein [Variovorax sp. PBS-H4]|uniref:hypothetical protein n=1 Tax=Variovorax sp. PBS-H4 TaxID=434008 RepID=UPI0013A564DA|nr:hypothetical protein [Variovorax sp. PBS-H4]
MPAIVGLTLGTIPAMNTKEMSWAVCFGLLAGVVLWLTTDRVWFLGVGAVIGILVGLALNARRDRGRA